jgi:hypothetical protein
MVATMARRKDSGRKEEGEERRARKSAPIQIEKELARWAAVISSHDGITQSELVSDHLRPFLRAHYERVQQEIQAELKKRPSE